MLGEKLRILRQEMNMTQMQLAEHLGVTGRTIGYYEADKRFPSPETINRIADLFDVSVDWLFGRTNIRAPFKPKDNTGFVNEPGIYDNVMISVRDLKSFIDGKIRESTK